MIGYLVFTQRIKILAGSLILQDVDIFKVGQYLYFKIVSAKST